MLAGLVALLGGAVAQAQPVLIVFATTHDTPSYIAQHLEWIESRPFDGLVINDYLGRNLLNTQPVKSDAPNALDGTGAVTYDAAAHGLSPVKGVFRKFHYNFAKVNFSLNGPPPLLNDEAGWMVVRASAANYAKAVADTGLAGIFFDNEGYIHPPLSGKKNGADYWLYEDQIALAGQSPSAVPLAAAVAMARQRGRELMQAFTRGYPAVTVIVTHGPYEGCNAWKAATGHFAMDHYLSGAFAAGMVEGASGAAKLVDGGEDYDLRTARDFSAAHEWRNGTGAGGITGLGSNKCPFMDAGLAGDWQGKVSVGFSVFDKERASPTTNNWTPITDVAGFRTTLANALRTTDRYVWLYTEWQDWWGNDMEDRLQPWIKAIGAARQDVGLNAAQSAP
jgi:hypothetical protein